MAVANSLTAVVAGARQIECTINGIGERAGNCSLEEVVMALKTRAAFFNVTHRRPDQRACIRPRAWSRASPACRSRATRRWWARTPSRTRPASTSTACCKHHSTYEILRPEDVGLSRSNLVLGKHSGRHAFRERVKALGFELDELELNRVFEEFKALADRKKELFDGDIEALVLRAGRLRAAAPGRSSSSTIEAQQRRAGAARMVQPAARRRPHASSASASGDGPVDAAFKAIEAGHRRRA